MDLWDNIGPGPLLGMTAAVPANAHTSTMPGIARSSGPAASDKAPLWSPDNPLFWFGALALATFGLIGVSTSFRVGTVKAGVAAGKP